MRAGLRPAPERPGELEAPLVVGYSYGGYLAQALVRELGGARGLLLVCPVVEPDFARRTQPPRRVAAHDADLAYSSRSARARGVRRGGGADDAPVLERFQRAVHPANIAADAAVVTALRARYALSRPLGDALGAPGRAGGDRVRPRRSLGRLAGRGAAGGAAQASHFIVLPDCGHLLPFEQPLAFAQAVRDFLARVVLATLRRRRRLALDGRDGDHDLRLLDLVLGLDLLSRLGPRQTT